MQITLNIKKRGTMIIVAVFLMITMMLGAYATVSVYKSSESGVGHNADEIGSGKIAGNLNITGDLVSQSDIVLGTRFIPVNLTAFICSINSTYCTG